jgi:carbonic anhydrase
MHMHSLVGSSCTCLGSLGSARVGRRGFLLGLGSLALQPRLVRAASVDYEAMILGCIDPRLQTPVRDYAVKQGLDGKYSQFIFAGAAIGAVAPKFADWHKTFWDNLAITIQLHNIHSVIAIDHRDCGAAKVAYGDDSISTPEQENATHKAALAEFRKQVAKRQPKLKVETLLMALDGSVMTFT